MKCPNCGAVVGGDDKFCTMCGSALIGDTNYQMNQQQTQENMTQYMYQPNAEQPESNTYQPNMGILQQKKKKTSKKPIIIAVSVIAVLAIALVVYLFPLGGKEKKDKMEITNSAEDYLDVVEELDVEHVLQMTIPKSLLKDLVNDILLIIAMYDPYSLEDIEYYTGSSVNEIVENFDEYYDMAISYSSDAIDRYIKENDISVELDDSEIIAVKAISINDILDPIYGMIDGKYADYLNQEGVTKLTDTFADNLDFDNMYAVYVKTGITISTEGNTISYSADEVYKVIQETESSLEEEFDVDFEFTDSKDGIRLFFAYEYDGEYYLLPDLEAAVLPALIRYIDKSRKSNDIVTARTIITAVETAMGREVTWCYFEDNAGKYFEVTESGFKKMDPIAAEDIYNLLDNSYPEVNYTEDGQKYFTFMVDEFGEIYVYISDGSTPDTWQILPETDDYYK